MTKLLPLATAALLVGAASASAAETVTLRLNSIAPPNHWFSKDLTAGWIARVEEATKGRVKIEPTAKPLGPMPRAMDIVSSGQADISSGNHGPIAGRFKVTQILDIPFIAKDPVSASVALWRTNEKFLNKAKEHEGLELVSLWSSSAGYMYLIDGPLTQPQDFKGKRIVVVSPSAGRIAETFGATPIAAATDKWFELLSRGTADGIISTSTAIIGWKVADIVRHQLYFPEGLHYASFFMVFNKDKWGSLSAEDRKAIMSVSGENLAVVAGKKFAEEDTAKLADLEKAGVKSVTASPEIIAAMRKDLASVEAEWMKLAEAAGVDAKGALAYFKETASSYKGN